MKVIWTGEVNAQVLQDRKGGLLYRYVPIYHDKSALCEFTMFCEVGALYQKWFEGFFKNNKLADAPVVYPGWPHIADQLMTETNEYVVGFLFNEDAHDMVLIRKTHPEPQRGKLNGVGGRIDRDETPCEAMERAFTNEAGMVVKKWDLFCTQHRKDGGTIYFFKGFKAEGVIRNSTAETVAIFPVSELRALDVVPDLRWLIPMALDATNWEVHATEIEELKFKLGPPVAFVAPVEAPL